MGSNFVCLMHVHEDAHAHLYMCVTQYTVLPIAWHYSSGAVFTRDLILAPEILLNGAESSWLRVSFLSYPQNCSEQLSVRNWEDSLGWHHVSSMNLLTVSTVIGWLTVCVSECWRKSSSIGSARARTLNRACFISCVTDFIHDTKSNWLVKQITTCVLILWYIFLQLTKQNLNGVNLNIAPVLLVSRDGYESSFIKGWVHNFNVQSHEH